MIDIDPNAHKREMPNIYAHFFTEEVEDEAATQEAGHVVYKSVDKVRWGQRGQNLQERVDRVDRLKKREPHIYMVMERAYEAWKKNQEPPVEGTPLKMWPAIKAAQIKTFINLGIRSVEELAGLTNDQCDRLGMGTKHMRNRARLWIEAAQDKGKLAERTAVLERKLEELAERNAELERGNAELHKALQATGTVQTPQRKAG